MAKGILDWVLEWGTKKINENADSEFAKVREKYDKETEKLQEKIKKDNQRIKEIFGFESDEDK